MITSITNVRPVGPGRLSFDLTAGFTGGEEQIVMLVDDKHIAFRLTIEPDEVRRVTVRYDKPGVKSVAVMAPASNLKVTSPLFDADGYGLYFKTPTPKDIIYCDTCDAWHEQGKPC